MKLKKALENIPYKLIQGSLDKDIHSITSFHKEVQPGSLFVAIKGFSKDGHDFVPTAIKNGAQIIVIERDVSDPIDSNITVIKVENSRKALAYIARSFYNKPDKKLQMIGITGTNGKTSTSYFLQSIYQAASYSTGKIGTNGIYMNGKKMEIERSTATTPDIIDLHKILQTMTVNNIDSCIMEVSSHALHLHRVTGIGFHTGLFMNLSPDHLELHKNLDEYFEAKAKLFDLTKNYNIINIDDPYGKRLARQCRKKAVKTYTVSFHQKADFYATNIRYSLEGTTYTVKTPTYEQDIFVHLPGKVNVYNSLMAIACAYANGLPKRTIYEGIKAVKSIPGRFNIVYEQDDYKVIVDFAHTEDALKNLLKTIKPFVKGRLILVFGVYADMSKKGREKRLNMGKVAGELADFSIVTLDNPKFFDQATIIKEITEGVKKTNGAYTAIPDREKAIQKAISISGPEDIVVIAGKGHETTQVIEGKEIPIDERRIVLDTLDSKLKIT